VQGLMRWSRKLDTTRSLGETAPLGLTPDSLSKGGTFLGDLTRAPTVPVLRVRAGEREVFSIPS